MPTQSTQPPQILFPNLNIRQPKPDLPFDPSDPFPIRLHNKWVDGVFEGGATLGAAYCGSLRLLDQSGIWFSRVAGNSAGAITASLIAAGYTAKEIEWLTSNFANGPKRPSTLHKDLLPINFMEFLDFPTVETIEPDSMKLTSLWRALKGQAIDEVLQTPVPLIERRGKVVDDIVSGLQSIPLLGPTLQGPVEDTVRDKLRDLLFFLPVNQPLLSDFSLFDETAGLRTAFADTVWKAVATANPLLVLSTQLLHEGSLFEGKTFHRTISRLLGAKIHKNPDATVQFNQLPIPLAVIGCNYATGRMEVYSTANPKYANMLVADAVRASMSLPLVFEPVGSRKTIIDGGVVSNFPVWLYTSAGDAYWHPASRDAQRPKIGFSLDETKPTPSDWSASPAKFNLASDPPPHVELTDVVIALITAKLKDAGLYRPTRRYGDAQLRSDLKGWKILEVLFGWLSVDKESASRNEVVKGLMSGKRYFDVAIPLLGFHGFDFTINSDREDTLAIFERGFMAARDALGGSAFDNSAALIANSSAIGNPYA